MYYIYIIRCLDQTLYTGITTDVSRRFQEHLQKKGAKYTATHSVSHIEAVWQCETRSQALKLEYWLKTLTKEKKEKVILNNDYFDCYLEEKIDIGMYCRVDF